MAKIPKDNIIATLKAAKEMLEAVEAAVENDYDDGKMTSQQKQDVRVGGLAVGRKSGCSCTAS